MKPLATINCISADGREVKHEHYTLTSYVTHKKQLDQVGAVYYCCIVGKDMPVV